MIKDIDILTNYEIIYKNNTWTIEFLSKYGFDFNKNTIIANNHEIVLAILNESLPYFYVRQKDTSYCRHPHYYIIIEDDIVKNISKNTKKYQYQKLEGTNFKILQFTKNILSYAGFLGTGGGIFDLYWSSYSEYKKEKIREEEKAKKLIEKVKKQQQQNFINDQTEASDSGGIYGIYSEDNDKTELLYIGLTTRQFQKRFKEHKDIVLGLEPIPKGMEKLYHLLIREYQIKTIIAKPIIIFNELEANKSLTRNEKEAMELALITLYQPPGNTSGIDVPYYFSDGPKPT